jgi:hypothetical protein
MILTIKTMKQEVYQIQLDDLDISVETLKVLIQSKYEFDANKLKLLFNGAILNNTSNLKQIGLNEGHILVMINAQKAKENNETITESNNPAAEIEEEEKQCEADIKVEEIPQVVASIMKILCVKNPDESKKYFEQLKTDNPQIIQVIKSKEAEFKKILYSPVTKLDRRIYRKFYKGEDVNELRNRKSSNEDISNIVTDVNDINNANVNISQDEQNVQNLMAFGFDRSKAEEAYFVCDKNYEVAINYLMDNTK